MSPRQFDFQREWNHSLKKVRENPRVIAAMQEIFERWEEIAEFKREEMEESDPKQAALEYQLDLLTFTVRKWDFYWQKGWTGRESNTLTPLSLAFAETLYPEDRWETLENGEYMVVTNERRTLVFDIQNFDLLTAGASLSIADDHVFEPSETDLQSAENYLNKLSALNQRRIDLMKEDLEQMRSLDAGNVSQLRS